MRISDWSPDVCSSDLPKQCRGNDMANRTDIDTFEKLNDVSRTIMADGLIGGKRFADIIIEIMQIAAAYGADEARRSAHFRLEEHTPELQSLMRISYAVFCLKKKKTYTKEDKNNT